MKKLFSLSILIFQMTCGLGQNVSFSGHFLYQSPTSRVFDVKTGDLDMDGNPDILFTEPDQDLLQWYHNENNGQFSLKEVGAFAAIGAIVVDFDADQDMDVLACSYDLNQVVFFENNGTQVFTMHVISTSLQHPLALASGDIDMDGDMDIVCATQDAGTGMILLRNDGNLNFTSMQLSAESYSSTWAAIIDLDQDNDPDILGNNFMATGGLLWYEQTAPGTFMEHLIPFPMAHGGAVGDIDGDGDLDLAGASCGSSIAWFENDGNNSFTKHNMTLGMNCPVSVEIADIDNDGHQDIIGEIWGSGNISWWRNNGDQSFIMKHICDTLINPSGLSVTDLNQDSLPDVVAGSYSRKLDWFENEGPGTGSGDLRDNLAVDVQRDPVTGNVVVHFGDKESGHYEVQLFDTMGRVCFSAISVATRIEIQASRLKPGIYLLRVISSGRQSLRKIIIG